MTRGRMTATLHQLATYLERDGATIAQHYPDGAQLIRVPIGAGGHADWIVPASDIDALNAERDVVYAALQARRRAAAR